MSEPDVKWIDFKRRSKVVAWNKEHFIYEAHSISRDGMPAYIEKSAYDALSKENERLKEELETAQEDVRFYRREWESACERDRYANERVKELEAELAKRESPTCRLPIEVNREVYQKLNELVSTACTVVDFYKSGCRDMIMDTAVEVLGYKTKGLDWPKVFQFTAESETQSVRKAGRNYHMVHNDFMDAMKERINELEALVREAQPFMLASDGNTEPWLDQYDELIGGGE